MKVDGLPYEFELQLAHVRFRDAAKLAGTKGTLPQDLEAGPTTLLALDADNELLLVERDGKRVLVPLANVASMVPA